MIAILRVFSVLLLIATLGSAEETIGDQFDEFLLRAVTSKCAARAWPSCVSELRNCAVERGSSSTQLIKAHVVVIELALPVDSAKRLLGSQPVETSVGSLARAISLPAKSILLLNSSAFHRIRLATELSFTPRIDGENENESGEDDGRVFVLIALGCMPKSGAAFDRFGRLGASLNAISKLVQRRAVCSFLADDQCSVVRYFSVSYRLAVLSWQFDLGLNLGSGLVRLKRQANEDYEYYNDNETLPEASGVALDELPAGTTNVGRVATPSVVVDKAQKPDAVSVPSVPKATTPAYQFTSTGFKLAGTSSVSLATRSVARRTLLQVDKKKRIGALQLLVGVSPVYPSLSGLFLLGSLAEDDGDAEYLENEEPADPSQLAFSIAVIGCGGAGAGSYCLQRRNWLNVCGNSLCGVPTAETIGVWQMRLTASLRDQSSVLTAEIFNVTVAPRESVGLPPTANAEPAYVPAGSVPDDLITDDDSGDYLIVSRPIKSFRIYVGTVLSFQFPADTFMYNSGVVATEMAYVLVLPGTPKRELWLQLNDTTRTIYALALSNELCGVHRFVLVATASSGPTSVAECHFNVTVEVAPYLPDLTHHFVAIFNTTYNTFKGNIKNPISVLRTLAEFVGDANPQHLTVTFMQATSQFDMNPLFAGARPKNSGRMVLFAWSNNSVIGSQPGRELLPSVSVPGSEPRSRRSSGTSPTTAACPEVLIRSLLYRMLNSGQLDMLSGRFVSRFPDWSLLTLKLVGVGACRDAFPAANLFVSQSNLPGYTLPFVDRRNDPLIRAMLDDRSKVPVLAGQPKSQDSALDGNNPYGIDRSRMPATQAMPSDSAEVRTPLEGNELLITIIIPSIVIALALVLSALIGCVLYQKMRQSRKRRCNVAGGRVYFKKGVPVIFAEELDDHVSASHGETPSRPLILPAEKPPLAASDLLDSHFSIQQYAAPDPSALFAMNARSGTQQTLNATVRAGPGHSNNNPYNGTTLPPPYLAA